MDCTRKGCGMFHNFNHRWRVVVAGVQVFVNYSMRCRGNQVDKFWCARSGELEEGRIHWLITFGAAAVEAGPCSILRQSWPSSSTEFSIA